MLLQLQPNIRKHHALRLKCAQVQEVSCWTKHICLSGGRQGLSLFLGVVICGHQAATKTRAKVYVHSRSEGYSECITVVARRLRKLSNRYDLQWLQDRN